MKSFTNFVAETVDVSDSPDVRRFIAKHTENVKVIDHTDATDKQKGNKTAEKDKSRKADKQTGEDKMSYEEAMKDVQKEKRKEIIKSMKKKQSDSKGKYIDKVEEVMHATAAEMTMKEQTIFEANLRSQMKLKDGSSVKLSETDRLALNDLFGRLSGTNKKRMEQRMMENKDGFAEILRFAKVV